MKKTKSREEILEKRALKKEEVAKRRALRREERLRKADLRAKEVSEKRVLAKQEIAQRKAQREQEDLKKLSFVWDEKQDAEAFPVTLIGFPNAIAGSVEIVNSGDEVARLRSVRVSDMDLRCPDGSALGEIKVFKTFKPGEKYNTALSVAVDPGTPAGDYTGKLTLGEQERSFAIHVLEMLDIRVLPDSFVIPNQPGETVEKTIFVTNNGNVKITIDKIGRVPLEQKVPGLYCGPIRAALRAGADQGHEKVLDIFAQEMDKALNKVGSVNVVIEDAPVDVFPGETKQLRLAMTSSKTVPPSKRFFFQMPISVKMVRVSVKPM